MEALEGRLVPATITVTTLADGVSPVPAGSLRAALATANNGDTIQFNPMMAGTISLVAGLTVGKSVTISSQGGITVARAQGATVPYAFVIGNSGGPSVTCEIDSLGIQNSSGCGIYTYSSANLTLNGCTISLCTDHGILNGGTLDMLRCNVTQNQEAGSSGGGIMNAGTLGCYSCEITNNSAKDGAGIFNGNDAQANLYQCLVTGNTAANDGGGIYNNGGTLSVYGSNNSGTRQHMTVDLGSNNAGDAGAGLYQTGSSASAYLSGASIVGNQVTGGNNRGGACCIDGGNVEFVSYCFIDSNTATTGSAIAFKSPGAGYSIDPTCTVNGTIQSY